MGQELHSCDTTQIDACASARFCVPSYASRWITGGHPSAPTCIRPDVFRPPSKVHSPYAVPLHSHRRQLSDARFCKGTPLSQRFRWYFVVGAIIAAARLEVNRQFKRKKCGGGAALSACGACGAGYGADDEKSFFCFLLRFLRLICRGRYGLHRPLQTHGSEVLRDL